MGKLVIGTESGVFVGNYGGIDGMMIFKKVLDVEKVNQIDCIEIHDMLIVLADKTLFSYPLGITILDTEIHNLTRKGKKISSSVSFFKQGICKDKIYISAVKSSTLGSTVKIFEPCINTVATNLRGKIGKFFRSTLEPFTLYKEFFIPIESSSVHFLKKSICIGCQRGFELVDLDTLKSQRTF
jgi:hypothetical protein